MREATMHKGAVDTFVRAYLECALWTCTGEDSEPLDGTFSPEDEDEWTGRLDSDVDIYTARLTAWLGSHVHRPGYCDEAAEEYGTPSGIVQLMQWGQLKEREEAFHAVKDWLENEWPGEEAERCEDCDQPQGEGDTCQHCGEGIHRPTPYGFEGEG